MDSNHRPALYESAALPTELRWPHPSIAQNQAVDKTGGEEPGDEVDEGRMRFFVASSLCSELWLRMTGKENEVDSLRSQ